MKETLREIEKKNGEDRVIEDREREVGDGDVESRL